jgi:hypothetical protein
MHASARYGYLNQHDGPIPPEVICKKLGCPLDEYTVLLAELDSVGVPRRTSNGIIYNKRMVEDAKRRADKARCGALGGRPITRPEGSSYLELSSRGVVLNGDMVKEFSEWRIRGEIIPRELRTLSFAEAWINWEKHRSEKRKPLTRGACRIAINDLAKMGLDRSIAAINHSIMQDYQGIYEPRNGHATTSRAISRTQAQVEEAQRQIQEMP